MDPVILLLILLIICGISAASFASDRNRSQAGWFIIGFLTGPLGLLVLLLLGARSEAARPMTGNRLILTALAVVAVIIIAGMSLLEAASQYAISQRYAELLEWGRYGDALIRFAGSSGTSPDAFVIKTVLAITNNPHRRPEPKPAKASSRNSGRKAGSTNPAA